MSPEQKAEASRIVKELERRKIEERIRYFKPSKPDDPNPNFPELGCNDQYGFIHSTAKERWNFGGARSGKTEAAVVDAIMVCEGTHPVRSKKYPTPVYLRFISTSWEDGIEKIIIPKFQEMTVRNNLKGGRWDKAYHAGHRRLTWKNGSFVEFMTSEQRVDKHRGVKRHGIYLDEHHPKPYYDESCMRVLDFDGFIVGTMTPEEGITWEKDHVENPADGVDIEHRFFWTEKNPYLPVSAIEDIKNKIKVNPKLMAVKLHGEFISLYGAVYDQFKPELVIIPDFEIPSHWERHIIIDPHLNKFTAILWTAWSPDGEQILYRASKLKDTVPNIVKHIRVKSAGEKYELWIADESQGGDGINIHGKKSVIEQLNDLGLPFQGTNQVSDKAFQSGIEECRTMISPDPVSGKPNLKIFESLNTPVEHIDGRLTGSIFWEFNRYRFKKEQKSDEETFREKVATVDDDLLDCWRYDVVAGPVYAGGEVTVSGGF
jgi:hypothetical protein